jgi:hypothetical protein
VGMVVGPHVVPTMDGGVNREAKVEGQQGDDDEMDDRVPAGVALEGLRLSHRGR